MLHDIPLDVMSRSGPHHALDVGVMTVQWLFVERKTRALFGLLFGAGTVLHLERLEKHSGLKLAANFFHRHSMWLLSFGILHGSLIWNGDILPFYGSLALLALYPLREIEAKRLIGIGLTLSLIGDTLGIANAMNLDDALAAAALPEAAATAGASHTAPTEAAASHQRRRRFAFP